MKKSLIIWSHHFFHSEKNSRNYKRLIVRYNNDFSDLDVFFKKLGKFLDVELTEEMYQDANELYTPKLKHHLVELKSITSDFPAYLLGLIALLMKDDIGNKTKLDELANEFNISKKYYLYNRAQLEEKRSSNEKLIIHKNQELEELHQLNKRKEEELVLNTKALEEVRRAHDVQNDKINQLQELLKTQQFQFKQAFEKITQELGETKQEIESKSLELNLACRKYSYADNMIHSLLDNNTLKNKPFKSLAKKNPLKIKTSYLFANKKKRKLLKDMEIIQKSGLFSPLYYLSENPDVEQEGVDILLHFCTYGWKEGRSPSQYFDSKAYLKANDDVEKSGKNPLVHYIKHGKKERRSPEVDSELNQENEENILMHNKNNNLLTYQLVGLTIFKKISKRFLSTKLNNKLESNPAGFFRDSKNKYIRMYGSAFKLTSIRNAPSIGKNPMEYVYYEPTLTREIEQEIESFESKPLLSIIIPVYNVEKIWIEKAIESVKAQWYVNWEINIVDDASNDPDLIDFLRGLNDKKIKIEHLKDNGNISVASNKAVEISSGEFIVLMDHDDELTPDALYEIVKSINVDGAEFIYSDEDKLEMDGSFSDPNFKPDYAPDTFLSTNYLSHLGAIKRTLVDQVGGFTVGLEGSQDYDLYLKVLEHTTKISHIQKVLYHWRKIPGSTAVSFGEKSYANEAGRQALQNAMDRRDIKAKVQFGKSPGLFRIKYELLSSPLVSIVIPFKDMPELLETCIDSILTKSTYSNFEIIGISNNSKNQATFKQMKRFEGLDSRIKFHEFNVPFNYSQINNHAVKEFAKGEHIIFLNNDIEIITPEWIEEMLMFSQQGRVGAVGSKLLYPNNTIQHAGLIVTPYTPHGIISPFHSFSRNESGYASRLSFVNNYSAVTAACLMIKTELFQKVGGFDEEKLKVAYNDVDLCLSLREKDYLNIYTPYCEAYHHESISRGLEDTVEKLIRCGKEQVSLKNKHSKIFSLSDPYYNKNLDANSNNFSLSGMNTNHRDEFIGYEFTHKIKKNINVKPKNNSYLCIFSHFDKKDIIQDYVIYYLESLSNFADIVFVTTCENIAKEEIDKIKPFCNQVIVKKNKGYDFGAWKTGMDLSENNLTDYDSLILCNDSVYGPFHDLTDTVNSAIKSADIFCMTDSFENEHHLQSYFIVYNKKAFTHSIFKEFWKDLKIYKNKRKLVIENEVKYHHRLIKSELEIKVLCPTKEVGNLNQLQYKWDDLITKDDFPFIKIEVLRDNPIKLDIKDWKKVIDKTGYDVNLIEAHLN